MKHEYALGEETAWSNTLLEAISATCADIKSYVIKLVL